MDTLRRKAQSTVDPRAWVTELPVESYRLLAPPPVTALAPYFRDWVAHERDDAYWRPWKISDHYGEMNVKALHAGGWHDIFLKGTIGNYEGMRKSSPAAADQRLLVGPWAHAATSPEGKIGDVTFGKAAVLDMTGTTLRWMDYALKGRPQRIRHRRAGAPLRDGGERVARRAGVPAGAHEVHQLLPGARGAGRPAARRRARPRPTSTTPPTRCPPSAGGCAAARRSRPVRPTSGPTRSRPDVLVFSTPPLAADTEVTGWVQVKLFAATSPPWTPTSPPCWRTWSRPAMRAF